MKTNTVEPWFVGVLDNPAGIIFNTRITKSAIYSNTRTDNHNMGIIFNTHDALDKIYIV